MTLFLRFNLKILKSFLWGHSVYSEKHPQICLRHICLAGAIPAAQRLGRGPRCPEADSASSCSPAPGWGLPEQLLRLRGCYLAVQRGHPAASQSHFQSVFLVTVSCFTPPSSVLVIPVLEHFWWFARKIWAPLFCMLLAALGFYLSLPSWSRFPLFFFLILHPSFVYVFIWFEFHLR